MNHSSWIVSCFTLLIIVGGIIAYVQGDYVSRGMAVVFLTGVFGIIAMIVSPSSKARSNDEHDVHNWPWYAHIAVLGQLVFGLILLIVY